MSYVSIVLVSHSPKVVEGVEDLIRQVMQDVPIEKAGGTDENEIGTSVEKIQQAIDRANAGNGVLVFYDIGSAKMNAEMAMEMMESTDVKLMEAPLLEGAYVAAVESGMNKNVDEVSSAVMNELS